MTKIEKTAYVKSVTTAGYKCDVCAKTINEIDPAGWLHFSSSHNEWGNDSVDSYEQHDVCSAVCYKKKVRSLLEYWDAYPSLNIGNMDRVFADGLVALDTQETAS